MAYMLVLSEFCDNDLLAVIDFVSVGVVGSTTYLNNEVTISQHSHHDTRRLLTLMPLYRRMLEYLLKWD